MEQIFLFFLTKYVYICLSHCFDQLKITLKIAKVRVDFFNTVNLHKNLC